jgi:hypothetical protein
MRRDKLDAEFEPLRGAFGSIQASSTDRNPADGLEAQEQIAVYRTRMVRPDWRNMVHDHRYRWVEARLEAGGSHASDPAAGPPATGRR